jgi:hypothetical protein
VERFWAEVETAQAFAALQHCYYQRTLPQQQT